jgi:transcription elongation factor Elf1
MNEFKNNLKAESVKPVKIENKADAIYVCGICGKPYSTIEERMACEKKCYDERKAAIEALKKQRLEEERETRKAEIETKTEELNELIRKFIKDYGSLNLENYITLDRVGNLFNFDKMFGEWF